ncbi:terminase small subunit [Cronobacter sakazakii]|uniref:terminase small subunit n=1 Tax=Cronobacter sakazakii TaxID=28141 RepID=UPI0009BBD419|nr:terminase small subunit [Cronobacter sakazakii]PUX69039.1 terminase small subunit [Cronobacter sakazakii]
MAEGAGKRKSTKFKPLTDMQERYCQEYVKTPDAQGQAAARAGFASPDNAAMRMMKDDRVRARIAELMEERNKRTRINADYVLLRLQEIDELDLADIMEDDLTLKPLSTWPKAWRQFLSGVKVAELFEGQGNKKKMVGVLKSIKWPDKLKNLELIGKHINVSAFKEVHEHNVNVSLADQMAKARQRAANSKKGAKKVNADE